MTANIRFRVPSTTYWRSFHSNGTLISNLDAQSSSQQIIRTSSGYTGKIPKTKPLPVNAYSIDVQNIALQRVAKYVYTSGDYFVINGSGQSSTVTEVGYITTPAYSYDNLYNQAVNKLNDKYRGNLDVSIDLAEAHKTLKMLKVTDRLLDYTREFTRKIGWSKLYGFARVPANAWLEYTYGIKPLAQTIFGVADESIRVVINKLQHYSGRASEDLKIEKVRVFTCFGGNFDANVSESHVKASVTVGANIYTDQFDIGRFSSLNPVSIAWELLPYSFVVDWVYNIGGYLRDLETSLLYANKFRSGYRTNLMAGRVTISDITSKPPTGYSSCTDIWSGSVRSTHLQRIPLGSYPLPTLPSFDVRMGSSRMLSASALLGQLLGRR